MCGHVDSVKFKFLFVAVVVVYLLMVNYAVKNVTGISSCHILTAVWSGSKMRPNPMEIPSFS